MLLLWSSQPKSLCFSPSTATTTSTTRGTNPSKSLRPTSKSSNPVEKKKGVKNLVFNGHGRRFTHNKTATENNLLEMIHGSENITTSLVEKTRRFENEICGNKKIKCGKFKSNAGIVSESRNFYFKTGEMLGGKPTGGYGKDFIKKNEKKSYFPLPHFLHYPHSPFAVFASAISHLQQDRFVNIH